MKRVLLVTSSYRPTMIADMHRVRHLAWELPKIGWDVEVLTPNVEFQRREFVEPESSAMFNPAAPVHEVDPADKWWFKPLKVRSIGWRALGPLGRAGDALLGTKRFDLVYISTANFNLFRLARTWTERHGIPCILDYHDPWVRRKIDFRTTRHWFKLAVGAWLARTHEKRAISRAAGVVAVSPVYISELKARYRRLPCLEDGRCAVIPFAGSENDLCVAGPQSVVEKDRFELAYVGAGGSIMARAFRTICDGLSQLRRAEPELVNRLRLRLYGTSTDWREGMPKTMEEIAALYGLGDLVWESPRRVSYLEATRISLRASGLLVLGIDGPGYMPSKLVSYALTGKPLLASFRDDSPMRELFKRIPGIGHAVMFEAGSGLGAGNILEPVRFFLEEVVQGRSFSRGESLREFLGPAMAQRHAELFGRIVGTTCLK